LKKLNKFIKNLDLTVLAIPGFIWFAVFCYLPMIGIILAFKNYQISGNFFESLINSPWVGLNNFKFIFAGNDAINMIRNTLGYNLIGIVLSTVLPIIFAILLNELTNKFMSKFYQTLMFFPYFLSWVIVSYFVLAFLHPSLGLANHVIASLCGQQIDFYSNAKVWPPLLVFLSCWKNMGYNIVLYLAAIIGIDKTYYEAAALDGATKLQQAFKITLPCLKQLIIILVLLSLGTIFCSDFGLFYQVPMNSGSLYDVTQTIDTYVYRTFKVVGDIGMSTAASTLQSVIGLIVMVSANFVIRKIDKESALF
jgi:putative aldouronate transport system permease protein